MEVSQRIALSTVAQRADQMHQPAPAGYLAERHPAFHNILLVWCPCNCRYASDGNTSFITPCGKQDCSASWEEIARALEELGRAEAGSNVAVLASPAGAEVKSEESKGATDDESLPEVPQEPT